MFRFYSGLKSNVKHAMITSSYHVDSVEESFHLALELELSFKEKFISKYRK